MATNPDPNGGAFYGPYTDPTLTQAGPKFDDVTNDPTGTFNDGETIPGDTPAKHAPADVGNNSELNYEPVTSDGTSPVDHAPGDQGAVVPPHSPVAWQIEQVDVEGTDIPFGRDPYRNDGMIGQDFLKNQG
jgi:hypothetical protein